MTQRIYSAETLKTGGIQLVYPMSTAYALDHRYLSYWLKETRGVGTERSIFRVTERQTARLLEAGLAESVSILIPPEAHVYLVAGVGTFWDWNSGAHSSLRVLPSPGSWRDSKQLPVLFPLELWSS